MGKLEHKIALITGAANGQGACEARLFASEGAAVVMTDIDDAAGQTVAAEIRANGGRAEYLHQDVADIARWQEVIAHCEQAYGGLHILINNAGIVPRKTIAETTEEGWHRTLGINLTGPMFAMKFASALIGASGGGSIVNVDSVAGLMAHYDAGYVASKWALRGLTKTAAVEFAPLGIRVNSIHPGQIADTALFRSASPELANSLKASIPMQRAGTPAECAALVLFLASDDASFITGAEIAVDGGYSAGSTMFMRQQLKAKLASS